ncbi:MBL fold metallo-hydrolase [uncultured Desulfobulbus sp.]|uniref:MBL fold metallo-hydrolase n=1 Tax=uncultured Desulfobulbus sp. TaxID=239745 RepID=UPI0029C95C09|nr:MBL fold metallo-hydrolase [uncultured Desulfobulbus sp.]
MPHKLNFLSVLVLIMQISCAPRHYQGPVSDHFDGERFFNPGKPMDKGLLEVLKWYWTRQPQPWPEYSEFPVTDKPPQRVMGNQLRISFVGHVTLLIQTQGLNILTDPVWSDRASPFTWIGPKRVHPPGIRFEDVPPIDLVLISHNHYDHLDLASVERLWRRDRPRIITPLGNDRIIHDRIPEATIEAHDWGHQVVISPNLTVHLEPMHHWSARTPFDRNRAFWAAFVLATAGGNVYFVADSGYGGGDTFRAAKKKFGSFRLAVLPVGDYDPRWFMAYNHMNPEEAVRAYNDLGQPQMLPTHYRTFQLADTGYEVPFRDLTAAMQAASAPEGRIRPLMAGEHWWVE